jgi:hypothetical protein
MKSSDVRWDCWVKARVYEERQGPKHQSKSTQSNKTKSSVSLWAHLSMYGLFSCLIMQAGIVISLSSLFPLFTLPYTPATIVTSITISFLNHILAALALAIDPLFPRHIYMS